jgi:hypothetical protein
MGNDESLLLFVPLLLLLVEETPVVMDGIADVTGEAVMGIVKASRCVRAEGPIATDGFFGGGGKRELAVIEGAAEAPG